MIKEKKVVVRCRNGHNTVYRLTRSQVQKLISDPSIWECSKCKKGFTYLGVVLNQDEAATLHGTGGG